MIPSESPDDLDPTTFPQMGRRVIGKTGSTDTADVFHLLIRNGHDTFLELNQVDHTGGAQHGKIRLGFI